MAKDLPVTVKNRKTGKTDNMRTIDLKVNNSLSKSMEGHAKKLSDKDLDGWISHVSPRDGVDPQQSRALDSGAKIEKIKRARRGKARK